MRSKFRHLKVLASMGLVSMTAIAVMSAAPSYAQEPRRTYQIEAQPLAAAIIEFSRQSDIAVSAPSGLLKGKSAPAVQGDYTAAEAMRLLVVGSGLQSRPGRNGGYVLEALGNGSVDNAFPSGENEAGSAAAVYESADIIVTAQKREQTTVEIPMGIVVVSAEELARKNIVDVVTLSFSTPGMFVEQYGPGRTIIQMRGVGNLVGSTPLTSLYLDEVPVTGAGQLDLDTSDLQRVEVLKGPQGTLYGVGAASGTIRYITHEPVLDSFDVMGKATAEFTRKGDPSAKGTAVLNAPIVNGKLGIRAVASVAEAGGWIDRPAAGKINANNYSIRNYRVKTLWKPSDAFSLSAMVVLHRNKDADGGIDNSDANHNFRLAVDPTRDTPFRNNFEIYNLTGTYEFTGVQLLSSTSYIKSNLKYTYSYIAGPQTLYNGYESLSFSDSNSSLFSEELRLASSSKGPLSWTSGLYYQDTRGHSSGSGEALFFGNHSTTPLQRARAEGQAWAAFADASYALSHRFSLGGGVRYFHQRVESDSITAAQVQIAKFKKLTWRANATYWVSDSVNAYANIGTGFRGGGFNEFGTPPYGPESLTSYEVGLKAPLRSIRTYFDLALFYTDYQDYLRRGFILNPVTNNFQSAISNLGRASIKGAEASLSTDITSNLNIYINGAYLKSEIKSISSAASGVSLGAPGDPLDNVPEFSFGAGAQFKFELGSEMSGFLRTDFNHRSRVSAIDRSITVPTMYSDTIDLLGARFGLRHEKWLLELFGENLLNENGSFDPWTWWATDTRPRSRTFGVTISYGL